MVMQIHVAILVSVIKASEARLTLKLVKEIHVVLCQACSYKAAIYVSGPELTINFLGDQVLPRV